MKNVIVIVIVIVYFIISYFIGKYMCDNEDGCYPNIIANTGIGIIVLGIFSIAALIISSIAYKLLTNLNI